MSDRRIINNELKELNSPLSGQGPRMPYPVPEGYFEGLAGQVLGRIRREEVDQELASVAPALQGHSRKTPYTLPNGYFEQVSIPSTPSAPVVPLFRRNWIRYASALAAILIGALVFLNRDNNEPTHSSGVAVVNQYQEDLQKLNDEQKDLLQDFVEAGLSGEETAQLENKPTLQSSMLADVSEQELTEFLEQSEPLSTTTQTND